ncbi:NusA-like transcription termination signal-binding factor [Candidatus Micrarchaeota archaeon]|nr:NusA-like transcription termination signal-binding factor [Candidatus Micrarchaeota archaeon]
MGKRVIDGLTLGSMSLFEQVSHVAPYDCLITDKSALFVVKKGMLHKSLGKDGSSIKRLKEKLGRNVWIVEHSANIEVFIKGLMSNIQITSVNEQDGIVYVTVPMRYRGLAIGKDGEIIKRNRDAVKRLYNKDLKLITK